MKTLAKVVVDLAGFLELSGDDVVDPDSAVMTLESMAAALASATPAEKKALRSAAAERAKGARGPARAFFRSFMEAAGLEQPRTKTEKPSAAALSALKKQLQPFRGDAAIVNKLLDANPTLIDAPLDANGDRPLHLAALFGYTPIVEHLISLGADINAVNRHKNTPLDDAKLNGHAAVVKLLKKHGG
jgi:hypothetical protein